MILFNKNWKINELRKEADKKSQYRIEETWYFKQIINKSVKKNEHDRCVDHL